MVSFVTEYVPDPVAFVVPVWVADVVIFSVFVVVSDVSSFVITVFSVVPGFGAVVGSDVLLGSKKNLK